MSEPVSFLESIDPIKDIDHNVDLLASTQIHFSTKQKKSIWNGETGEKSIKCDISSFLHCLSPCLIPPHTVIASVCQIRLGNCARAAITVCKLERKTWNQIRASKSRTKWQQNLLTFYLFSSPFLFFQDNLISLGWFTWRFRMEVTYVGLGN